MGGDSTSLKGDPKRQALPTLKGFSYQIWQSVYHWVTLKEGEALFLEGAEDIDVLGPGQAETIQVKETKASGTVTLRSEDILDAIAHFWEHQQNNPGVTVTFRFLTTAERGNEQPNPFAGVRGLDHWDSCKHQNTDVSLLRSFIRSQDSLPESLRSFAASSQDEELRQRLITRIEWDTGSKSQPYIEDLVNRKVEVYGNRVHGLPPSYSVKLVPHLLKHVWDVVLQKDARRLDYADFMRLFEEFTTERISKYELEHLRRVSLIEAQSKNQTTFGGAPATASRPLLETIFATVALPLGDRLVQRDEFVKSLHSRLNTAGFLVLKGSTGMGKSTLANSVVQTDGGQWRWLDMRGREPEQISDLLLYATQIIVDHGIEADCIIDDLNFDKQPSVYENPLAKFIYALKLRNKRVIITTHGSLPSRIVHLFDIPTDSVVEVPTLSEEEVKELTINYGCPQGHKLKAWSRIIYLNTSGHPQLAHARVHSLEAQNWPSHTLDDLMPTQDIREIKQEARSRLREQLPSNEARQLAYRLSIFNYRFKRIQALRIGHHPPRLEAPGEALDLLIGPWVERVDDQHFRLSPLLNDAAKEVFTEQEVKELHGTAAMAYLAQETITPTEYSAVLFHGLLGEAEKPLVSAAMGSFQIEEGDWPQFSRVIDWFGYCSLETGKKLFAQNDFLNHLLRRLQFKIVAEIDPARALQVIKVWEQEVEGSNEEGLFPGTLLMMRFTFLNDMLLNMQVSLPLRNIVAYLTRIVVFLRDIGAFFPNHPEYRAALESKMSGIATVENFVRFTVARCGKADDAIEFLAALDDLKTETSEKPPKVAEPEAVEEIWGIFRQDDYLSMLLIDRIWMGGTNATAPDWTNCIKTLEGVVELGLKRGAIPIAVAAYRAKAIVQEEYLKDTEAALKTLNEAEERLGHQNLLLKDYRAKIFLIEERYSEALKVWEEILPEFESEQNPARTFSYRDAEICAARLGDWDKATEFSIKGESAARKLLTDVIPTSPQLAQTELIAIGYKGDLAFAQWKLGNHAEAVKLFAEILDAFEQLPAPESDIKSHMLYKRVGYGIAWLLHEDDEGEPQFIEPPPGFFSNQEVVEEAKDYPLQPRANLWYLLAKVEYKLNLGDGIFKRFEAEQSKAGAHFSKVGYGNLRLKHALRSLRLENLVSELMEYSAVIREYSAKQQEKTDWSDAWFLKHLLFAALIKLVGRNQYQSLPLEQWKKEASSYETLDDSLTQWFGFVERSFGADEFDLISVLKTDSAAHESRLLAALLLSARDTLDVEDRFYANVWLTITEYPSDWIEEIEGTIDSLVSGEWSKIAEHERFSLRLPNINAPKILSACNDDSCKGLKKAARVLLAVKDAMRTSVTDNVFVKLHERAK
jgi:hypothetical protein